MQKKLREIRVLAKAYFSRDIEDCSISELLKTKEDIEIYIKCQKNILEDCFLNVLSRALSK